MIDAMKCSEILKAFAEGKNVGYFTGNNVWCHFRSAGALLGYLYDEKIPMVRPEPKLVPWTMMDVPLNCWFRYKAVPTCIKRALSIANETILFVNIHAMTFISVYVNYKELFDYYEYTLDNKTWHPCGKVINE